MSKKTFTVLRAGTYGKTGDTIELDVAELSERQKLMLKPYEKPVVKVQSDGAELKAALEEIKALKAKIAELEKPKAK